MRWRPFTWLLLSIFFFVAAAFFWRLGDQWAAKKSATPSSQATNQSQPGKPAAQPAAQSMPFRLLTQPGNLNALSLQPATQTQRPDRFANRLSNTSKSIEQLEHTDKAILLQNALIDTANRVHLAIPDHLRAHGEAGSYVIQSRTPLDDRFRAVLKEAGAEIVSYIPNNAYLIVASAAATRVLAADEQTQVILPWDPYYKLEPGLLKIAVDQEPLPEGAIINVLLFSSARERTLPEFKQLNTEVLREQNSAIGPIVTLRVPAGANTLPALAALRGVQLIELVRPRAPANDLSRATIGVASNSISLENYLGLSGSNVLVNVNDTGIDATHPDLAGGRISGDSPFSLLDTSGHGTHVAGIIAGSGALSTNVINAQGSIMPAVDLQFRGKAPAAKLFSMSFDPENGQFPTDAYLQETAARTNAFISDNGWNYSSANYDLAAASYDAAVRDALPRVTGSQSLLYVFPAGNRGGGNDDGSLTGTGDTIQSPATAKNVITVGGIELPRGITNVILVNCVTTNISGTNITTCQTNKPWGDMTDSSDQVAGFSSRGNVGIGIEGNSGRFKPDVVAPATFVVSTRSRQWNEAAYYSRHDTTVDRDVILGPGFTQGSVVFIPENATQFSVRVFPNAGSPSPFPGVPIFINKSESFTAPYDITVTNQFTTSLGAITPGGENWFVGVGNSTTQTITFSLKVDITFSNENDGIYFQTLSNLNNSLETSNSTHYYRYESGTSMAAADASGTLALMQDFLQNRLGHKTASGQFANSPALMKALLINGARSVGNLYDFQTTNTLNLQGWGLINLTNSLHGGLATPDAAENSMFLYDQSPTHALATGQSHTRKFHLTEDGQGERLRVTLVWSDPPGNPAASIKLVNDLDLIVTNLDNGDVFFGNDFLPGNDVVLAWDTNGPPHQDVINNVENIFLPPQGANYSVTVVGRRVNVNAVTANPDNVVQDYALIVSSGNGDVTNALSFTGLTDAAVSGPIVTIITNTFAADNPGNYGAILTRQRVGANSPLLGTNGVPYLVDANAIITLGVTNQWHFYVLSNGTSFTNAAFATFAPPNLSVPVMGARQGSEGTNATRVEADIDIYVSRISSLTNLLPSSLLSASKGVTRGGTETILLTNVRPGTYYIAVKSEDQRAAEYSLAAIISELPFSDTDENGNVRLRGVPAPIAIPDGSPHLPGSATILAFAPDPSLRLHRVIVTNVISHQLMGDLFGALTHEGQPTFTVLNNHTIDSAVTNAFFVYDDSSEHNVPNSQHTDGPGSLHDFAGKESGQQWILTMVDSVATHIGTNIALGIFLEKQQDLTNGITTLINPGACREDFLIVPPDAIRLTVTIGLLSGAGPLSFEVCPLSGSSSGSNLQCKSNNITGAGSIITIDRNDVPPLNGGEYVVRLCNNGITPVTVHELAEIAFGVGVPVQRDFSLTNPVPILDDAVTTITNSVTNHFSISSLEVGLLIKHPRVSDLAITLISPNGTRILLFENRGGLSTDGLGSFSSTLDSQGFPAFAVTTMTPTATNSFEQALTGIYMPGAEFEGWNVLSNSVAVVRNLSELCLNDNVLVLGDGVISNSLPTTNSTSYRLSFNVTHSPYIVGMVSWWPFDEDAMDIFGGLDGILCGDPQFVRGEVDGAFQGDGVASSMMVPRCPDLDLGMRRGFTIEGWIDPANVTNAAPLVEWNDLSMTNIGVQFWLAGRFTGAGGPGSLSAKFWDTTSQPHVMETAPFAVTNSAWQHIALTFDAATPTARFYVNGSFIAAVPLPAGSFVPKTSGDLYFGYHAAPTPVGAVAFKGGLDEFSVYERALCDCEIAAIASAGSRGKYGNNALTCPVTTTVQIPGVLTTNFVNGTNWFATGPQWENNVIEFNYPLLAGTNGVGTNLAPIIITPVGCPGAALDEFVLSSLLTNYFDGLLHFTDDTNLAPVAIKFAPAPYTVVNFPPKLIFTNGFENSAQGVYALGSGFAGSPNDPSVGQHNWTTSIGSVAVVPTEGQGVRNAVALAAGAIDSTLPTIRGHRYQLSYSLRGPCAAGWWNGDIDPESQRAKDLLGRNNGAFINGATNSSLRFVGPDSLFLPGMISHSTPGVPDIASKIELGDPVNLRFTNSFSIETWVRPIAQTNDYIISLVATDEESAIEQIFFRGDLRRCLDPYYLALEQSSPSTFDLLFHVESADSGSCGITLEAGGDLISAGRWQHVAAVYERNVPGANDPAGPNQLRLYVDGVRVTNLTLHAVEDAPATGFTTARPFANLDPGFSPGVAIGNRSRGDGSEPFRGTIDELSVYDRALSDPEIAAIFATGRAGKFDPLVPTAQSLAKVSVEIDGDQKDVAYGDNAAWTTRTITFTALRANAALRFQSLLPGTEIGNVSLTEIPAELNYQPEEELSQLNGQDAFGQWRLEIWDTRTGATNTDTQLVDWQLAFHLLPEIPQPVISLAHCVPYENTIPANSIQYFVVDVPQWASIATNILSFAHERFNANPLPVTMLFNQTSFPGPGDLALIGPAPSDSRLMSTNTTPLLLNDQAYFLAITNPNPVAVDFAVEVCFDTHTLNNCQPASNFVAGVAGIPTYFQFDVPSGPPGSPLEQATIWLTGANSNLTVVLSQSLPLPDLGHYDYISARPCTNDEIFIVLTNSTPFPLQTNHWYIGVFNNTAKEVPFTITACYGSSSPTIIPLTNAVPYVANLPDIYVAPPGPPRSFFFEFSVTSPVSGLLFELYNLSGDVDLVLQKDVPPGQWPYFDSSFMGGTNSEQIVVRRGFDFPDLRGNWFLGVYNNESTNVSYTIRATTSAGNGMLISGLPFAVTLSPLGLLQWNSIVGETYEVQVSSTLTTWTTIATLVATTTCSTFEIPRGTSGFVRVVQVPPVVVLQPPLKIQFVRPNQVRISWPTSALGFTLQSASSLAGPWSAVGLPVSVVGTEFVVFDTIGPGPLFYRLFK